jgi:transcriptional regulator with XRE-family HTH domain
MSPLLLRVREYRDRKHWTQAQLAERAGVRQATVSLYESGKARRVDLDVLDRIAHALGVPTQKLLQWVPRKKD